MALFTEAVTVFINFQNLHNFNDLVYFFSHISADGVTYTLGIFYVEFLDYFKSGKSETSWIASILVGVTLCSGIILHLLLTDSLSNQ